MMFIYFNEKIRNILQLYVLTPNPQVGEKGEENMGEIKDFLTREVQLDQEFSQIHIHKLIYLNL